MGEVKSLAHVHDMYHAFFGLGNHISICSFVEDLSIKSLLWFLDGIRLFVVTCRGRGSMRQSIRSVFGNISHILQRIVNIAVCRHRSRSRGLGDIVVASDRR